MLRPLLFSFIKKYIALFIGMSIIAAFGFGVFSGMTGFNDSCENALYQYLEDYGYPDAVITVDPTKMVIADPTKTPVSEQEMQEAFIEEVKTNRFKYGLSYSSTSEEIEEVYNAFVLERYGLNEIETIDLKEELSSLTGVKDFYSRIALPTVLDKEGDSFAIKAISYSEENFTKFVIWDEIENTSNLKEVRMEYNFAKDNDFHVGDKVNIRLGDSSLECIIGSIVTTPETLGNLISFGSTPSLGYVYFSESELEDTLYEGYSNQFCFQIEDIFKDEKILNNASNLLDTYGISTLSSYTKTTSDVQTRIDINVNPVRKMCYFIPIVYFVIALSVIFLCFTILMNSCRHEIGILMALGFKSKDIKMMFYKMAFIIGFVGITLGMGVAYAIMIICCDYYAGFYPIPSVLKEFNVPFTIAGALITFITVLFATFIGTRSIDQISPKEIMTREIVSCDKEPWIVRTILKNAKPAIKFSFTTLFRNPKRLAFSIFCMSTPIILIFSSLAYQTSCNKIIQDVFEDRIDYNYNIFFSKAPSDDLLNELSSLEYVSDVESIDYYDTLITSETTSVKCVINGIDPNTKLIHIPGNDVLPNNGIILDDYNAKILNVKVGDSVMVLGQQLEVVGISKQYSNRISYISKQQSKLLNESEYGFVVCNTDNPNKLKNYVVENSTFLSSCDTNELYQNFKKLFDTFIFITIIISITSIIIGLFTTLTITRSNLNDKKKELSILMALGLRYSKISNLWFIQTFFEFVVSIMVGLPMSRIISGFALSQLTTRERSFPYANGMKELLFAIGLAFIFTLISHIISVSMIRKWNLAENTKNGE